MAAYRRLFSQEQDTDLITAIRKALNTGLVSGNERFPNTAPVALE